MTSLPENDRKILRELARRKAEIAADPINEERRALWYALDEGHAPRPLILAEVGGVLDQAIPLASLRCTSDAAQRIERALKMAIFEFESIRDDHVQTDDFRINWPIQVSDFGVQTTQHYADNDGDLGARSWDAPLKNLSEDCDRLKPRTFSVDRAGLEQQRAFYEELFGDILEIRLRGSFWWTQGLTMQAIDLVGLEGLMLAMYDDPDGLHRLMAFLRDEALRFQDWVESEGLLTLNNENDYIGSGSMGYTHALPQPETAPGRPVRIADLWGLCESQETVGVGPDLFEAFIFPYQHAAIERFGRSYYGCCEPVNSRWHVIQQIKNLKRVSVSPWCDQDFMGEALRDGYVFSRKPNPALISTENFDEVAICEDLRTTLQAARGCALEIVMKDVHTLNHEPDRLGRWVALAREVCGG